ncbi:Hypothetical_protein [Hexamita inflata]|uniref:Hypothetical_protein n=1 Tax=Hexamita inflata TaxID=28002 RepID=A0AA86QZW2_9EUKA|nr:Hypothetical protein HINF_LOCUS47905 [Hexamita inflata]
MIIVYLVLNNVCEDFDCHGFACKETYIPALNKTLPECLCDQTKFYWDCQYCRNFRYSVQSNCSLCIDSYLDPLKECNKCKDSENLDVVQECTSCIDEKYDIKKKCNACTYKHMDFSKGCNSCEGDYILLVNECISKAFSNFTIYFGIIFSHIAIVIVIIVVCIQHRKKKIQKSEPLITE